MEKAAERLKYWLRTVPEQFGRLSETEVSERPMPGKWSPKEALKVIEKIPAEKLSSPCVTGNQETKSLQWLIDDYVEHMEYHLNRQILKNNV
ncbi:hypothetical protein NLX71_08655 [Paenibacillus sp. MZ04-78.2]|uniref:hypothetical protein n=1 Tax=Paenibacillus sp. MZ04-78.2 TaxID=2962034 RepID=UPI0020B7080A|nr:hypothetical protein [Paenibacillus sp. MZ04-78.2]MCP3773383.1 hypothetical protein [Paenibacillus sp. MZ04-78.2]